MEPIENRKPMKFFVDFENVHGAGLKGVVDLSEQDEVLIFYSQAAETFHIEHAIDLLNSTAQVKFVEIDGGTRNALDFQLVAALFATLDEAYDYAIVSGDGGFDAALKMGKRLNLPNICRITDLTGSTESPQAKSKQRGRSQKKPSDQHGSGKNGAHDEPTSTPAGEQASETTGAHAQQSEGQNGAELDEAANGTASSEQAGQESGQNKDDQHNHDESKPRRRSRRRRSSQSRHAEENHSGDGQQPAQVQQKLPAPPRQEQLPAAEHHEQLPASDAGKPAANAAAANAAAEQGAPEPEPAPATAPKPAPVTADATAEQGAPEPAPAPADTAGEHAVAEQVAPAPQSEPAPQPEPAPAPAPQPEPAPAAPDAEAADEKPGEDAAHADQENAPARSGRYSKRKEIKALLASNGVSLTQQQLASVMKALNGVKNKRAFYQRIIQLERQENGLELYRNVRDYYTEMVDILHA